MEPCLVILAAGMGSRFGSLRCVSNVRSLRESRHDRAIYTCQPLCCVLAAQRCSSVLCLWWC